LGADRAHAPRRLVEIVGVARIDFDDRKTMQGARRRRCIGISAYEELNVRTQALERLSERQAPAQMTETCACTAVGANGDYRPPHLR
jgi:hypothetical protein